MSTYKVKVKLSGLEIEIEGSREDIPLITGNINRQLTEILEPATNIIEGQISQKENSTTDSGSSAERKTTPPKKQRQRSRKSQSSGTKDKSESIAIDWVHDPTKWGFPKQDWNTANKAIWLLYVVQEEKGIKELSADAIAATFNKHFKQANTIRNHNVARDLGKLRSKSVSEDTTVDPHTWFLTIVGIDEAKKLITELRSSIQ